MEGPPAIPSELVKEFVNQAHSNLEYVRDALESHPSIVNASWDWGGGDWETALGAAAHMGKRDIALLVLSKGARMDIFAAAMLGDLDTVKAIIALDPDSAMKPGPHGISLESHAKRGGKQAAPVLEFLKSLG